MVKPTIRAGALSFVALLLAACGGGSRLELEVKARVDGQPATEAQVVVDGRPQGATDSRGVFTKTIQRRAGTEVEVVVSKELPGHRIEPWKTTFIVRLPKTGTAGKYAFDAELRATRFLTLAASDKGTPIADATVKVNDKEVGKTDARGEFVYEYKSLPKSGVTLSVSKTGYATWHKTGNLEPGRRLDIALSRRAVVNVSALTEQYGYAGGVAGVTVSVDDKPVGKTDERGAFTFTHDGPPGKKVRLTLSAPGHIPAESKTVIALDGQVNVQRSFAPSTPRQIRVGVHRFAGNTLGVDLGEIVAQTEGAISRELFKYTVFREVPRAELEAEVKRVKLGIDRITTRGWQDTPLRKAVDMIVVGSVAKDDKGFVVETKFYASNGRQIVSQVARPRDAGAVASAAREIAANVMERFPFEGTVVAVESGSYRVNIGKPYRIARGTELLLTVASRGDAGKAAGYRETGRLKVKRAEDAGALVDVEDLKKGEAVKVGDRVVRRIYREGEEERGRTHVLLSAKGGLAPDVAPLPRVNVYLNNDWVGSTDAEGKAEVPIRLGRSYTLLLYRHGYQQVTEKIKVDRNGEARQFVLSVNNASFKVDSDPSSAAVFVDGDQLGTTPILEAKPVALGFHTVKLTLGEDYRDWEEVVEFDKKVEDRTGDRKIPLHRDYLKIGERAAQKGDLNGAMAAYTSTDPKHPDYSEAHHRLAQIYLDEKNDYDAAIREFESVLALPQNRELISKRFAVAFTNLGHAYYEKGNSLIDKDRDAAARMFAKAIQNLQTAKQNTRFFPTADYDEALHNTYFYLALSYHKLYLVTRKDGIAHTANLAWREYFDFFPKGLEGNPAFVQSREAARKYWAQIKDQS
jgi:tetratricopeptide (TPR) repeat protein